MKLYQTPGGTWAKSEKDWSDAMKAEGRDPKKHNGRRSVDVPVKCAELMEFLTFHNVNVIEPRNGAPTTGGGHTPAPPLPPPVTTPYESPISARTTIERIDSSMITEAIKRMSDGKSIGTLMGVMIDRVRELTPPAVAA